jgi:dTDP-4-dehydrorhamnose reductase
MAPGPRVLLTGAGGQLGRALQRSAPAAATVLAVTRADLDIGDARCEQAAVDMAPTLIINCAAYTAVDGAESAADQAFAVNAHGAERLARAAQRCGARLLHVSTDFVFDGRASRPYRVDADPAPLGVYGASKAEGERRVRAAGGSNAHVVRTAWLYSSHGSNFLRTMLRLMGERDELGVVADQIGSPTRAEGLAQALWRLAEAPELPPVLHWTDLGVASWYDFAVAIQEEALARGLLTRAVPIRPLNTEDYPTPARRPAYSVLDKSGAPDAWQGLGRHWRVALRAALDELSGEAS